MIETELGFSPEADQPVRYIERTRAYYAALGFGAPYRWASFESVPFTALRKPLARSVVALVTTACPFDPAKGDQGPGAPYNAAAKFYQPYALPSDPPPDLRIAHVAYDRDHTTAADPASYNPLAALHRAVSAGAIGAVSPRVHGAPTNRSQRATMQRDAPDILTRLQEDGADVAVLVPNCPVCHQSVGLVARHLEQNGIPTVIMGCAKDIVETCGVPRFCFSDFPLGNAAGRPHDTGSQAATLALALAVLAGASGPRTTTQSRQRWAEDPSWKLDYSNPARLSAVQLQERRLAFSEQKDIARGIRPISPRL